MTGARALASGVILALALIGCAGHAPELQTRVETVEVQVPVRAPCPDAATVPTVPRRVAEDHPTMPALADGSPDFAAISLILGAKVIELFGYAETANGQLSACSRP